jgi:hypothetical protein
MDGRAFFPRVHGPVERDPLSKVGDKLISFETDYFSGCGIVGRLTAALVLPSLSTQKELNTLAEYL